MNFSRREKIRRSALRALMKLPTPAKLLMSGVKPLVIDGQRLHPDLQLILSLMRRERMPSLSDLQPKTQRVRTKRETLLHRGAPIPVGSVRDFTIPGPGGEIRVRHYAPANGANRPLLIFLHGGGFVLCDIETHDQPCRFICRDANVHVLSVEYRLAPEHPYPAAILDAEAAFRWACANAASLGADPSRIAIGGDSAGANISAVVSLKLKDSGERMPTLQLLIYPAIDRTRETPSLRYFADGFFLTRKDIDWFHGHYGAKATALQERDLRGLPPAILVTAAFDPLRDEGEAYARALSAAGVETKLMRMTGMIHGFLNLTDVSPACRVALSEVTGELRHRLR